MFGKLLKSVSWQIKADFRRSLKSNQDHKNLSWNLAERLQIYCSTHYILAMLMLWFAATVAVGVAEYFRPVFYPFAHRHLRGITNLSEWMSDLLGSQLTVIGIVFPLVVGLISVLFQKKSSRIHIQSAYQLHSGYMFSGLSGLSLAAFILIGGLASSRGDKYLDTAFAVTAFVWMFFNIWLSIWFFITSLNVLDDNKRDVLMKKYFQSHIVSGYLQKSMMNSWIRYPGYHIGENYLNNIKILPYSLSDKEYMNHITCKVNKNDIVKDVYIRPLLFLLRRIRTASDQDAKIIILPSSGNVSGELRVLSSAGVEISRLWAWLYRCCLVTGARQNINNLDDITYDFFSEAYDALNDKNISVFKIAVKRLVDTYSSIKRSFSHAKGNYLDALNESEFSHSFSQSFQYDLRKFIRETVKSTDSSGEYFYETMYIPLQIYRNSESTSLTDFKQFMLSLFGVWHALNEWKAGLGVTLSASQEQTHQGLIRNFISQWEGWSMGLIIGKSDDDEMAGRLLFHLHNTVRLLIPPVVADNDSSARYAHDVLCLWYNQSRFTRHWEEEFRWHSFFLTPDYLHQDVTGPQWNMLLRGNPYNKKAALSILFSNALSDMRLLISGYIIAHIESQKNIDLSDLVNHLLASELYEGRDSHDTLTPAFRTATDIIDIILRIEHINLHKDCNWYAGLSETIDALNSFNERPLISGRVHSGVREDLGSLYGAFALLAIKLSRASEQVTQRVTEALAGGVFSYFCKCRIISILEKLKRDPLIAYEGYIISLEDYANNVVIFNEVIDKYIDVFNRSKTADIIGAAVDTERLRNIDTRLTNALPGALAEDILLTRFSFLEDSDPHHNWQMRYIPMGVPKDYVSRQLNENFSGELPSVSDVKANILHRLHYLLGKLPAILLRQVNDLGVMLQEVQQRTADQRYYILVVYGSRFSYELMDLIYQVEKHGPLGIHVDASARGVNGLPFRINNCLIYQVRNTRQDYSLLVSDESFGELKLFRYPDGTLFNTFYRSSEDPLEGVMKTLWELDMQVTGSLVARFEHI
ncbi:hypothetical protein M977_04123 [Buttiauxella gaviniae ATCC 51604]|uniref:Uncharacterized protein n=1 Tax=Buttiauxella gaviniae ATCC 51604 TaxID=1354253 RepID=A0A1B7HP97_9ENTR|nr:hypothetical protein [Buttiauxella gaviniae]OAT17461.1 hypothetical protein M977_04123 [Buttiauxella gaviniae ATCC 51604]